MIFMKQHNVYVQWSVLYWQDKFLQAQDGPIIIIPVLRNKDSWKRMHACITYITNTLEVAMLEIYNYKGTRHRTEYPFKEEYLIKFRN